MINKLRCNGIVKPKKQHREKAQERGERGSITMYLPMIGMMGHKLEDKLYL